MSRKIITCILLFLFECCCWRAVAQRPNILFVISDDQSYPHASAYGEKTVNTPGFDFVANQGALFTNAYVTSPGCSPSRASILTGLYPWQLEEAGSHASSFSTKFVCFPELLQQAGYKIGYTGKGWGPGDWKVSGRLYNPAGPEFNKQSLDPPFSGVSRINYAGNFKQFLSEKRTGQPFYFWLGANEPHRPFEDSSWLKKGYSIEQTTVPGFLPNNDVIKGDLLDYATEIAWFDSQLVECLEELKQIGELDNTIIIVTSDNGMSFPYAKANCTDAGIHVPLAICWKASIPPGQVVKNLVSAIDFAPTILDVTGISPKLLLSGESLLPLMTKKGKPFKVDAVFAGRERHSFSRHKNLGYPMRSIRWSHFLLVQNFHPERWPAGDPRETLDDSTLHVAYYDIDDGPSKSNLIDHKNDPAIRTYYDLAMGLKRPTYELFDLRTDAACLTNLADDPNLRSVLIKMKRKLTNKLTETKDTRLGSNPEIWETYPRLEGKMRNFRDQ